MKMSLEVEVQGKEDFLKAIYDASDFEKPLTEALSSYGAAVTITAKSLVPVRTGRLQRSLGYKMRGMTLVVGSFGVPYALPVEVGTSKMAPRSYLLPALKSNVSWYNDALKTAVENHYRRIKH